MKKTIIIAALISALFLLGFSSLFIVRSDQFGIITRFGKVVRSIDGGGLYMKWPYPVEQTYLIDRKKKVFQPEPVEVFLPDEENVVRNVTIAYYAVWRISDPLKYFETLRDETLALIRMENNLRSLVSNKAGQYPFRSFISTEPSDIRTDEISRDLTSETTTAIEARFGITIEKVDISKLILPEQNKEKVFERMVAERSRISNKYRAEGEEQAKIILSEANREKSLLLSEAELDARRIVAEAEAEAAALYAEAYNKNPSFYRFWRQLEAFGQSYGEDSTFILSSEDPLLLEGRF